MRCPVCGESCSENTRVCPGCGSVISRKEADKLEAELAEKEYRMVPIDDHSIVGALILTWLTGGLYGLYWFFRMDRELNRISGHRDKFGIITLILMALTLIPLVLLCIPSMENHFLLLISWLLISGLAAATFQVIWVIGAAKTTSTAMAQLGKRESGTLALYFIACYLGLAVIMFAKIQSILNAYAREAHERM